MFPKIGDLDLVIVIVKMGYGNRPWAEFLMTTFVRSFVDKYSFPSKDGAFSWQLIDINDTSEVKKAPMRINYKVSFTTFMFDPTSHVINCRRKFCQKCKPFYKHTFGILDPFTVKEYK